MIPRLIHQTWKSDRVPSAFIGYYESWPKHNPGWRRILWTDRMLLEFVGKEYPELFEIFCSYPRAIMRADAARYMILHKFGGVYADLDAECMAPLTPLEDEDRVILCHEPPSHWPLHAPYRSHPWVLFNGVMAGPAGHPFWRALIDRLPETRHATDVLDATGPCFLSGVYLGFDDKQEVAVYNCQLFNPTDNSGVVHPRYEGLQAPTLAQHHWAGTWWTNERNRPVKRFISLWPDRIRHAVTSGRRLNPQKARAAIDRSILRHAPPSGERTAVLVPVRDAAGHVEPFLRRLADIDLPANLTKLVFCEGDSRDGTWELLNDLTPPLRSRYRDIILLRKEVGTRFERTNRSQRRLQRTRRAGIAAVRNHMIDHGLDETDDWALWIDVDIWHYPEDIVSRLKAANARIVVPNCVIAPGGPSFDANSFANSWVFPPHLRYRYLRNGLLQPPPRVRGRLYLDCLRHTDRVELDAVGGTMLLVDASLHRGGLRFPELPYKEHIETEGLGLLARDLGIAPVGLPRVEILHTPD